MPRREGAPHSEPAAASDSVYHSLVPDETDTFVSRAPRDSARTDEWALSIALDCEHLDSAPLRLSLARINQVEIGRGAERGVDRHTGKLRLDVADRWASQVHARLLRNGTAGWVVEDADSKNGTRRNGARVKRSDLADGDV